MSGAAQDPRGTPERDSGFNGPPRWLANAAGTSHDTTIADAPSDRDTPGESAMADHVREAAQPIVAAVFRAQANMFDLACTLAQEIAAFCGDPAVGEAGNWEVQVPLDPALLPNTTLYLSLSPFKLSLRFDTSDVDARQLLLNHGSTLERELDALLNAWGAPRDIELTVW